MRTLRWAAERAVSAVDRECRLGIAALESLGSSPWLEREDRELIAAVVDAVTAPAAAAYHELGSSPRLFEVVSELNDPGTSEPEDSADEEGFDG